MVERRRRPARRGRGEGLIGSLSKALKATGVQAERYAKLGVAKAEQEKEKLALKSAYAELGRSVARKWSEHGGAPLTPDDPSLAPLLEKIAACRGRIARIEARMSGLRPRESQEEDS